MKMMGFAGLNPSYELEFHVIASLLHVIASAAKQSILSLRGKMDCFASLAMTARQDGFASRSLSSGRANAPDDKLRVRSPALKPVCPARHIRHSSAIRIEKTARHQPAG
jgi:hypothetical protein